MSGNSVEWALRVCESIAFSLHSVIGLTEPLHGIMKSVTEKSLVCPNYFFPLAGIFLAIVAYVNLACGDNDGIILGVQCYIAAFHTGAVYTHYKVNHHPAAAAAPDIFILLAWVVMTVRQGILIGTLATLASVAVGVLLGLVFVRPKPEGNCTGSTSRLLNEGRVEDH